MAIIRALGGYELDDDPARIDREVVWAFLSRDAYWGRWRSRADVDRQIDGAWRVVGAHATAAGQLVGFARAVSDGVAIAYLADVFVLPDHRGHGLGSALVAAMIEAGPGAGAGLGLGLAAGGGLGRGRQPARTDHTGRVPVGGAGELGRYAGLDLAVSRGRSGPAGGGVAAVRRAV